MTEFWIKCSEKMPPKDKKFLFSYFAGIGIAKWGTTFKIINGNSERTEEKYILVLEPDFMVGNIDEPFEWNEKYMIEMDVSWMPLPSPPTEETF